jgi:hypothetical protein
MTTRASPLGALDDLVGQHLDGLLHLGVVELAAHQALDREDRVLGVDDRLAPRHLADQALAGLGVDGHHRRDQPAPSEEGMTTGSPPSMTATTELVVPRSMPMILPHCFSFALYVVLSVWLHVLKKPGFYGFLWVYVRSANLRRTTARPGR